jgi:uncharacterized protein YutE (UPF0331/DUF86 family)
MNEKERQDELKERINEKIKEIKQYLEEFSQIEIPDFEEYQKNFKLKAACERYFEKIVEPIINLALLIIRLKKFDKPENEDHIFIILSKNNVISEKLARRLKDAKDMRNIVIHNYLRVDDLIVYTAIAEEIVKDAEEFLEIVGGLE